MRLHQHEGGEFIYVLRGRLTVQIAGEAHRLKARDSVYFDASTQHGYRRDGARACAAIVVTSP
jgi:quercetin dioxygenase-like cupin family protein